MLNTPFESFYILFYIYSSFFTFSNLSFFLIIIIMIIYFMFLIIVYTFNLFQNNILKCTILTIYKITYNIVYEQLPKEGIKYVPYLQYLFFFIFCSNLFGFFPYSIALTSQISLIFIISLMTFLGMQYIAIELYKTTFFRFFLPPGIPTILSIFISNIEIISYIFRVISLSVRILANIIAGHLLCKIIAIFVLQIYGKGGVFFYLASIPSIFIIALCFLELFVCFLQAYVFLILCCIYLRDVLTIYLH